MHCQAVERWHQTFKNRILLDNYFLTGDLEAQITAVVDHYNHQRLHERLNNVTLADVYFSRDKAILKQRERIKQKTPYARRLHHRKHAAQSSQRDEPNSLLVQPAIGPKIPDDGNLQFYQLDLPRIRRGSAGVDLRWSPTV